MLKRMKNFKCAVQAVNHSNCADLWTDHGSASVPHPRYLPVSPPFGQIDAVFISFDMRFFTKSFEQESFADLDNHILFAM